MKSFLCVLALSFCALAAPAGELQEAAAMGDVARVRTLLRANPASIHAREGGTTALHEAARAGHLEVVKLLVAQGANVNAEDISRLTPLRLALGHRRMEVAAYLQQNGGVERVTPPTRVTAVAQPAQSSTLFGTNPPASPRPEVSRPAPTSSPGTSPTPSASTALRNPAVPTNTLSAVSAPLTDRELLPGIFPIHELARVGDVEQIKTIYKSAPEVVEATDDRGLTALHVAAAHRQFEAAKTLIGLRAKVNVRAENGQTPLHAAARSGDAGMVALLLTNSAAVDAKDNLGQTPLLIVLLAASSAAPAVPMASGRGPAADVKEALLQARVDALNRSEPLINLLLRAGADVNVVDARTGKTPLHVVADLGHLGLARAFLGRRARVDAPDTIGDTALCYALRQDHKSVAAALRAAGATTGRSRPLNATEQSLAEFYQRAEQALQRASGAEKAKLLVDLNPTEAECRRMFPKHAAAAWKVVDHVNRLIREEFSRARPDAEQGKEIWRVSPEMPSALVQEWRARGVLATDLPVYSLTVEKVGATTRPGDYCLVNGRWVMMPPLRNIAAQMTAAAEPARK